MRFRGVVGGYQLSAGVGVGVLPGHRAVAIPATNFRWSILVDMRTIIADW